MQELQDFLPVIRRLAEDDGMSSDERGADDDHCFYSARPFWRHPSVTDWLHDIDSLGSRARNRSFQREGGRRRSSRVDGESRVVRGLPVNFYDWGYLSTLDRPRYLDLNPKPAISLGLNNLPSR